MLTQRFLAISWLEKNEHERLSSCRLVLNTSISSFPVSYSLNVLLIVQMPDYSKSSVTMKRKKSDLSCYKWIHKRILTALSLTTT